MSDTIFGRYDSNGQSTVTVLLTRCILHIEDEEAFSLIAKIVLEDLREAIALHHAATIDEAYKFLFQLGEYKKAPKPDLILLDLNLRSDSGYEVLETIRATDPLKHIPVVIFSSMNAPSAQRKSLALGALAHICKPSSYEDYLEVLREIINMIPKQKSKA